MALMSDPIAVADATPTTFKFSNFRSSVNVQVRFYTDADGRVELTPRGTGSRDIVATNTSAAYSGGPIRPTEVIREFVSDINNGSLTAAADGKWYELTLGGGMGQVTLTSAPSTTPGTAVTYRVFADAEGQSATG